MDATSGATLRRFGIGALRGDAGWPHPIAMDARGGLVVAAPGGVALVDPSSGRARAIATGLGPETSTLVAADDRLAYAVFGEEVAAIDLASGARRWAVRVGPASSVHALGEHLVFCDADGGATVIERASGAAALRVGVGGCTGARARSDGTLAIAGRRGTWIVGSAPARADAPARIVEGVVTLDGAPAAGLPVLVGVWGVPLDGVDGCPALPEYAQCVLADAAGRFRAVVRARGWLPVVADLDVAARRAGRPRAEGGGEELDLDAGHPPPLRFELRGADEEL
ncbi:MAG: PQQ-like beta-propeller repeat protein [Sandaracinaceae bacterium]|nr:PQQ-like beta-propeller repeat protein [Sandaracinaceae bacterium]